jgi:hypothetical protein
VSWLEKQKRHLAVAEKPESVLSLLGLGERPEL